MKKTISIFLVLFTFSLSLWAEGITVSGTVSEAGTNDPLPGVSVQVKGSTTGTITDADGKYSIEVSVGSTLVFSQIGLKKQEIKVAGTSAIINVAMSVDDTQLDQVVVIGYGSVKKSHLSGAVNTVSAEKLNAQMYNNVSSALQGKVPGVSISSADGNPASGPSIYIRGVNSLVNNTPLYIVDGAISDISMVSANDIASIEILKDASAAAIYGSRAAAGVVLITTKTGRKDMPTKMELNFSTGISMLPRKIQMMDAHEWSVFSHMNNLSADGYGGGRDANGYFKEPVFQGEGTDWQDVVYRTAMTYNVGTTISGGSKTATYSTSANYISQEGIMRQTDNQTYNIRVKSDYSFLDDRLKIGETIILRDAKSNGGVDRNTVWNILEAVPTMAVYNPDNVGGWGYPRLAKSPNPLAVLTDVDQKQVTATNILVNAYAELRIIDELKYKANLSLRKNRSDLKKRTGAYNLGTWGTSDSVDMEQSTENMNSWVLEHTLSYAKKFGKHDINLLAGYSSQKDRIKFLQGKNTKVDPSLSIMPGSGTQAATSTLTEHSLLSMFARVMYSYDNRYLLSASIRRDGSSRFEDGHRFGTFPSVSVGWNIREESFAKPIASIFDQLKLRLSYGELGNEVINGYYPTQSVVSGGYYYTQGGTPWYGQLPFTSPTSPSNLKWETTKTGNIGLDFGFLNNKITASIDAFYKRTEDILLQVQVTPSAGLGGSSYSIQNAGIVDNKGLEFNIDYVDKIGDVNFYAGLNFSTSSNKVKEVRVDGVDVDQIIKGFSANANADGVTVFMRNQPMAVFHLLKSDGLFRSWDEVNSYKNAAGELIQPNAEPGDQRFIDFNGDGKIDIEDLQPMGNVFPDLEFGIRLGADWRGFDINLFFDGVLGRDIYNYPAFRTQSGIIYDVNLSYKVAHSWREDNQNTGVPRFDPRKAGNYSSNANSDRWLEDGSFFRLKSMNIGYTLPQNILKKIKMDNVRVYANFENIFTATSYSGYSPDLGSSSETPVSFGLLSYGVDHGRYPLPRTISFGIQVGF